MKHIFNYILVLSAVFSSAFQAQAQTRAESDDSQAEVVAPYKHAGSMATGKTVEANDNGTFTITLETFAEGSSSYEDKTKPADIVLVLDRSGSMNEPYVPTESRTWTTNDIRNSDIDLYYREWNSYQGWYDYYGPLYVSGGRIYGNMVAGGSGRKNIGSSYTGVLYHDIKLDAMKDALYDFIEQMDINDRIGPNGQQRTKRLGNRIAIVTFSASSNPYSSTSTPVNSLTYLGNSSLDINNTTGITTLNNSVRNISASGGTGVDSGINRASSLLGSDANRLKTVVVFTDGIPGQGSWSGNGTTIANNAINYANSIKGTDGTKATVWTIGVFEDMNADDKAKTDTYMNRVSSNYVNVTDMTTSATAVDTKYYIEVGEGQSLADAFKAVAEASGGSDSGADSNTQIKDGVTSSFVLPDDATAESINLSYYTQAISADGKSWGAEQEVTGITPSFEKITSEADGKQHNTLVISGFDFAKDDTKKANGETNGDGNWVGLRYKLDGSSFYAGKKLVVKFDITANPNATGGDGTSTNIAESGVYVQKTRPDGTKYYENVNSYDIPHTNLPINIVINKNGLRSGESATFEIFRIKPKKENGEVVYNAIGKPEPNEGAYTPKETDGPGEILEGKGWEKWSKVVITNKTENNGEPLTRKIISLDPSWIYAVVEDQWGWAYTITGEEGSTQTTSSVEINPFSFTNVEKENAVKHAEAVTINHFNLNGEYTGKQEEHYKSSKVEKF